MPRAAGRTLRLFISTGEVSGDLYGASLTEALHRAAAETGYSVDIRAVGGRRMADAGARIVADSATKGAVGFIEPLRHLLHSLGEIRRVRYLLRNWRPDVAVLIDYPGFNIPLAGRLRHTPDLPIVYYMPPEECIWARTSGCWFDRTDPVVRRSDLILTLHGRDSAFFSAQGGRVRRVGHPVLDLLPQQQVTSQEARQRLGYGPDEPLAALLPASRAGELRVVWPVIAGAAAHMARADPQLRFLLPLAAPHLEKPFDQALRSAVVDHPELGGRIRPLLPRSSGPAPSVLAACAADVAVAKTGSVTLELALRGVPQVQVYVFDRITEWIGRKLLGLSEEHFEQMSLPNFILDRDLVPEFIQQGAVPERIAEAALALLDRQAPARLRQLDGYADLRRALGEPRAAQRAAEAILELIRQ